MTPGKAAVSRQPSAVSDGIPAAGRWPLASDSESSPPPRASILRTAARRSLIGPRLVGARCSALSSRLSLSIRGSRLAARGSWLATSRGSTLGSRLSRGFTLIEILIVISIIGILITLAQPSYNRAVTAAKEAALKENLFILRDVIDQYYADNTKYPESLAELVNRGYIRRIPKDPVTGSTESWVMVNAADEQGQAAGIYDIKSGSDRAALDGSKYNDW